jgi:3-hydroxyisobutyrate dehydrogenase
VPEARRELSVGFIGIGHMGGPMARRLCQTGFDVVVCDSRPEAVAECIEAGARSVQSMIDIPRACELCLVCVSDAHQVEEVVGKLLAAMTPASALRMIVIHSTITPEQSVQLDRLAQQVGVRVVDAPVSGNLEARSNGNLAMMVGATAEELGPYRAVLTACSRGHVLAGRLGAGSALKLINNVLSLIQVMSLAEATRLTELYGIDDETFRTAIGAGSGDCYAVRNMDYYQHFPDGHPLGRSAEFYEFMRKDLYSALDSAAHGGVRLPLVAVAAAVAPEVYARFWPLKEGKS